MYKLYDIVEFIGFVWIKKTPSRLPSLFHLPHFLVWYRQGTFKNGRRAGLGTGTLRGGGSSENWRAWSKQRIHLMNKKERYFEEIFGKNMDRSLKWTNSFAKIHDIKTCLNMSRCQTRHERKLLEENGSSSKNTKETLLKNVPLQWAFSRSLTQRRTGFSKGPAKLQNGKTMGKYEKTEALLKNGTEYIQDPISMDGTKQSKTSCHNIQTGTFLILGSSDLLETTSPMTPVRSRGFSLSKSRLVQLGGLNFPCSFTFPSCSSETSAPFLQIQIYSTYSFLPRFFGCYSARCGNACNDSVLVLLLWKEHRENITGMGSLMHPGTVEISLHWFIGSYAFQKSGLWTQVPWLQPSLRNLAA